MQRWAGSACSAWGCAEGCTSLAETCTRHAAGGQAGAAGARTTLRAGPLSRSCQHGSIPHCSHSRAFHRHLGIGCPSPEHNAGCCLLPPSVCRGPPWAAHPRAALGHGRAQRGLVGGGERPSPGLCPCLTTTISHLCPEHVDVKAAPLPARESYVRIAINVFLAAF